MSARIAHRPSTGRVASAGVGDEDVPDAHLPDEVVPARIERVDHRLVAAPGRLDALVALGLGEAAGLEAALRRATRVEGGRAPGLLIDDPRSGERLRLRAVRRGGALAAILPRGFATPDRAERELALWLRLRARGAPLPEPVAAIAHRRGSHWQMFFVSLEHGDAVDGLAWLGAATAASPTADPSPHADRLAEVVVAFARALRRLHDAGAVHGDLHLRNVLIDRTPGGPRCLFVDLDHAVEHAVDFASRIGAHPRRGAAERCDGATVPAAARVGDWMRIARSLEKNGFGALVDRRLRARALDAYAGDDWRLRAALLEAPGAAPWRIARHRLAWRLRALFATRA